MEGLEGFLSSLIKGDYAVALSLFTSGMCLYFVGQNSVLQKQINKINAERINDMNEAKRELISILKKSHDIIEFLRGRGKNVE